MKTCKNNADICFCNIYYCDYCSFLIGNECKWLSIKGKSHISECGGVKSGNLSDIFKI